MGNVAAEQVIVPEANQWRQAWTSGEAPPPTCHHKLIQSITACLDVRGKRILEVGAGTGRDSVELAALGADVYALDFTHEALRLTQQQSEQHNASVRTTCGDTRRLPFETASFDLVFSQGLLEHFSEPAPIVREQARLLRPGGLLLVDVPQKYSFYTVHKHRLMRWNAWFAGWETEFSLAELTRLLRAAGLKPLMSYGEGYYPAIFTGIRNLHTFDQRRTLPLRMPEAVREAIESSWQRLEAARWFHRWMTNIGVVAEKI